MNELNERFLSHAKPFISFLAGSCDHMRSLRWIAESPESIESTASTEQ